MAGTALLTFLLLQSPQPAAPTPAPAGDAPMTLSGCVARRAAPQNPLTFSEAASGDQYRLNGRGLGKYAGQRVEIVGGPRRPKRFSIRGGLLPSANVAGQAGDLDPAQAAIANLPESNAGKSGSVTLQEFFVTRVRVLDGSCQ